MKYLLAALVVLVALVMRADGTDSIPRRSFAELEGSAPSRPARQESVEVDREKSVSHADRMAVRKQIAVETQDPVVGFLIVHADEIQVLTGFVTQPFEGSGEAFTVERQKNSWLITSRAFWFSPTASAARRQNDALAPNHAVNAGVPHAGQ